MCCFLFEDAELAGIRDQDYLIEVNGQNVESLTYYELIEFMKDVKYPQPLQLLVVNKQTYDYYKQTGRTIHHNLPDVKIMLPNEPVRSEFSFPLHYLA